MARALIDELQILGDWAYLRNYIDMTLTPPGGATFTGVLMGDASDLWLLTTDDGYGFVARLEDLITDRKAIPEGTRKKLHDPPDYKSGVAALYAHLGIACVPATHNSGVFWVGGFLRRPGKIILEFLEPIPPGMPRRAFMTLLQQRIETATGKLLANDEKEMAVLSAV